MAKPIIHMRPPGFGNFGRYPTVYQAPKGACGQKPKKAPTLAVTEDPDKITCTRCKTRLLGRKR